MYSCGKNISCIYIAEEKQIVFTLAVGNIPCSCIDVEKQHILFTHSYEIFFFMHSCEKHFLFMNSCGNKTYLVYAGLKLWKNTSCLYIAGKIKQISFMNSGKNISCLCIVGKNHILFMYSSGKNTYLVHSCGKHILFIYCCAKKREKKKHILLIHIAVSQYVYV